MSGIRINARQRKVIEIALVLAATLLLLGLIIDASDRAAILGISSADMALLRKYGLGRSEGGNFIPIVLRSPRLYIAGLLVGLAVFIHRGPKDEKA